MARPERGRAGRPCRVWARRMVAPGDIVLVICPGAMRLGKLCATSMPAGAAPVAEQPAIACPAACKVIAGTSSIHATHARWVTRERHRCLPRPGHCRVRPHHWCARPRQVVGGPRYAGRREGRHTPQRAAAAAGGYVGRWLGLRLATRVQPSRRTKARTTGAFAKMTHIPSSGAPSSSATGDHRQTLERGAVGFWQLTYQSISLVSPAGAMAATLTGAAAYDSVAGVGPSAA